MKVCDNTRKDIVTADITQVSEVYQKLGGSLFIPYMRINSPTDAKFVDLSTGLLHTIHPSRELVWLSKAKLLADGD